MWKDWYSAIDCYHHWIMHIKESIHQQNLQLWLLLPMLPLLKINLGLLIMQQLIMSQPAWTTCHFISLIIVKNISLLVMIKSLATPTFASLCSKLLASSGPISFTGNVNSKNSKHLNDVISRSPPLEKRIQKVLFSPPTHASLNQTLSFIQYPLVQK